jgi:hypothetical protein
MIMAIPSIYQPANYGSSAFIQGFLPQSWTNTTVVYGPGSARAYCSDWILEYPANIAGAPGTITINTATVGLNGTYPGTIASITPTTGVHLARVYAVGNSSGTTDGSLSNNTNVIPALVIATATTGFVPPGNDMFREVGFVLVNSSGNLVPYAMNGNYQYRSVMLQDALEILTAGVATTPTKVDVAIGTLTSPSTTYYLPSSIVHNIDIAYDYTPNSATDVLSLIPFGLTSATRAPVIIKTNGTALVKGNLTMPVGNDSGNAAINYSTTSGSDSANLWLAGFDYNLPWQGAVG